MDLYHAEVLLRDAMVATAVLSLVPLGASVAVGLFISVMQAATQIQEQSLTYVVKLLVLAGICYLFAGRGALLLVDYSQTLFDEVADIGRGPSR